MNSLMCRGLTDMSDIIFQMGCRQPSLEAAWEIHPHPQRRFNWNLGKKTIKEMGTAGSHSVALFFEAARVQIFKRRFIRCWGVSLLALCTAGNSASTQLIYPFCFALVCTSEVHRRISSRVRLYFLLGPALLL